MTKTFVTNPDQPVTAVKPLLGLLSDLEIVLKYYSNVHRGSGYNSNITTRLYEKAKDQVLNYFKLDKKQYEVIFCSPASMPEFCAILKKGTYKTLSSSDIGLPVGIRAVAVKRSKFPKGAPFFAGGGTARLTSPDWVVWEKRGEKFEAGTPPVINAIAFVKALKLAGIPGSPAFENEPGCRITASDLLYQDDLRDLSGFDLISALSKSDVARNSMVPTLNGINKFVNFDYAASTPALYPAWEAFSKVFENCVRNEEIVDEVRKICSTFLNAPTKDYDLFFTSNTTEAINMAARYLDIPGDETVVVTSLLEHTSNDLPWRINGRMVIRLNIDSDGIIDIAQLESLLNDYNEKRMYGNKRIRVVSLSGASNVLGTYNDLTRVSSIVHRFGALMMTDAAQMAAHHEIDMKATGIDCLAFSGHKVYAPFGAGVLAVKKGILKTGKHANDILVSGEENIAGIAALGKALVILKRIGFKTIWETEHKLTAMALKAMSEIKGVKLHGVQSPDSDRFPQKGAVIAFSVKGIMPYDLGRKMEGYGIGFRFGCHCAHILVKHILNVPRGLQKFQHLLATFFPSLKFPGVNRISFGIYNTPEEVEYFVSSLQNIINRSKEINDPGFRKKMDEFIKAVNL